MESNDIEKGHGVFDMTVKIRSLTGQTQDVSGVPREGTVGDLKRRVEAAMGIPTASQRLIYSGRELSGEEHTLHSFGVADQSIVHMVIRSEAPLVQERGMEGGAGEQNGYQAVVVEYGGEDIFETYRMSKWVMIFAYIDAFFLFLFGLFIPLFLIFLVFPISAIYGVKQFKKAYLIPYGLFLVVEIIGRLVFISSYGGSSSIVFNILSILIDMYILNLVSKLYKRMMNLTPEQIQQLTVFGPLGYINRV